MRFPGFIGPSYKTRTSNYECQRSINLIPEFGVLGTGKDNEVAFLFSAPGLKKKITLPAGPIRALFSSSREELFCVSRDKLYRIEADETHTELGTLSSTSGRVSLEDNGNFLIIVDGLKGYRFRFSDGDFAEITDEAFTQYAAPTRVGYIDGRFVFFVPDSQTTFISNQDDVNEITFDGTEFTSIDSTPDNIVSMVVSNREIWYFKKKSTEVWFNAGGAQYPYSRVDGAVLEIGCEAPDSVVTVDGVRCWVGKNKEGAGVVYMAEGYQPKKISTQAIDFEIQKYGDISDARAFAYQSGGHSYYVLNFTSANTTWVFDFSTGLWHERPRMVNGQFERGRSDCHAFAHGRHYVGDFENGNLYELSDDYHQDDDKHLVRQRVAPHVTSGGRRVFYKEFQLDLEMGVGLDGLGQGTDPKVILEFSDDGGHAWSKEIWATMGKIGERRKRARWTRLGQSRDRVFRVTITDPVKVVMLGANLEFLVGGASGG